MLHCLSMTKTSNEHVQGSCLGLAVVASSRQLAGSYLLLPPPSRSVKGSTFDLARSTTPTCDSGVTACDAHFKMRTFAPKMAWLALLLTITSKIFGCANAVFAIELMQTCFVSSSSRRGGCRSTAIYRRLSLHHTQYKSTSTAMDDLRTIDEIEREFFISDAQFVHLGPAARILTEEFYSQRTNFITFQVERLKTVLSLESTFPGGDNSLRRENYSRRKLQQMFVACNAKDGQVVGFAEVDARPLGNCNNRKSDDGAADTGINDDDILRSYMYNLAVDKKWKRNGIASALIDACEKFVMDMHDSCIEKRLYLRVRRCNDAAVALYQNLGYEEMDPKTIDLSRDDINSGSMEEGELILFAKDLPIDAECAVD